MKEDIVLERKTTPKMMLRNELGNARLNDFNDLVYFFPELEDIVVKFSGMVLNVIPGEKESLIKETVLEIIEIGRGLGKSKESINEIRNKIVSKIISSLYKVMDYIIYIQKDEGESTEKWDILESNMFDWVKANACWSNGTGVIHLDKYNSALELSESAKKLLFLSFASRVFNETSFVRISNDLDDIYSQSMSEIGTEIKW